MENNIRVKCYNGSIFDHNMHRLEAIIIYVPCGMTFLRGECHQFLENKDRIKLKTVDKLTLYKNESHELLKYIIVDKNESHSVYSPQEMEVLIDNTMNLLNTLSINRVGMNGIRCSSSSLFNANSPEEYLINLVRTWGVKTENHNITDVYFIDKRGGFNR